MINESVQYLDIFLEPLGFKTLGLTTQTENESGRFPAAYLSGGSYDAVNIELNTLYHRILRGPLVEREAGPTVKKDIQKRTYELRLVGIFDNNLYCLDTLGGKDYVLSNLLKIVNVPMVETLRDAFKLNRVTITPTTSYRDKEAWQLEMGVPYDSRISIIAVDYRVEYAGLAECFEVFGCGDEPLDVLALVRAEICNVPCDPGTITINGDAFGTVASGGSVDIPVEYESGGDVGELIDGVWVIPDCEDASVTVNDTAFGTVESGGSIDVPVEYENGTPVGSLLDGVWTIPNPVVCDDPRGALPTKTGQTISYTPGDDGDLQEGRNVDFFTLDFLNPFSHTFRFTGLTGGYSNDPTNNNPSLLDWRDASGNPTTEALAIPDDIVIDWASWSRDGTKVLGWYRIPDTTSRIFNDAIAQQFLISVGAYTSGWRVPNKNEIVYIQFDANISHQLLYAPFRQAIIIGVQWLSTRQGTFSTFAKTAGFSSTTPSVGSHNATTTRPQGIFCRTFTVSGTTLT